MFYKLVGMVVWNGGKFVLRQKYGRAASKPVLAAGVLAVVAGVAILASKRDSG